MLNYGNILLLNSIAIPKKDIIWHFLNASLDILIFVRGKWYTLLLHLGDNLLNLYMFIPLRSYYNRIWRGNLFIRFVIWKRDGCVLGLLPVACVGRTFLNSFRQEALRFLFIIDHRWLKIALRSSVLSKFVSYVSLLEVWQFLRRLNMLLMQLNFVDILRWRQIDIYILGPNLARDDPHLFPLFNFTSISFNRIAQIFIIILTLFEIVSASLLLGL